MRRKRAHFHEAGESGDLVWFRHHQKHSAVTEDTSTLLSFEVTPLESTAGRKSLSPRALINGLTMALVVALLVVSVPFWASSAQHLWMSVFPPPPYTGSLLFTQEGNRLIARRTTDGNMQWNLSLNMQSSSVIHYGNTLYVSHQGTNRTVIVEAVRAQDGHVLWQSARQGYDILEVIGVYDTQLYVMYRDGPTGKGILAALDVHTGQTQWATAGLLNADGYLAGNNIMLCQDDTSSNGQSSLLALMLLDRLTGKQHWSQTFSLQQSGQFNGYTCGITATEAIIVIDSDQTGTLHAFDVHTGTPLWQTQVGLSYAVIDQEMIYLTTWIGNGTSSAIAPTNDSLRALRASDGTPMWSLPGKYVFIQADGLMSQRNILTYTPNGLVGLDAQTGAVKWIWNSSIANASNWNVISGGGNMLYYTDQSGVYALHGNSGQVAWQRNTQSALLNTDVDGQQVYISDQLHISAVNARTGKLRWQLHTESVAQFVYCPTCGA